MKAKLFVTLAVLAAAGYGGYTYFNKPAKLTYLKAQVTKGSVEAVISATGTLSATRLVPVGSRVSGNVVKMYADYNTVVRKGQLLAEIDPSTFQNAVEQRQAALNSAETQRLQAAVAERRADVDVRNAETQIANQRIAVARSKSQMDQAKRKYDQQKGLGDVTSKDAIDTARETFEQAQLSLESAESQLLTVQATLESTKAQREVTLTQKVQAESAIAQAKGQLTDAELNIGFTKILSPVDGIVINRKLNEGETVQASTTAPQLYEIAEDLTEMHLDTNIDESDISRVQIGQQASFAVDAFPGQQFQGEVIQIRRGAVNVQNVISYTVVISVNNADLRLFPGMTANTRIVVDRVESTLRIPSSALRFRPPAELTVVGDVAGKGGKGKGGKDGAPSTDSKDATPAPQPLRETSKATEPVKQTRPQTETAKADGGKDGNPEGGGRRNRGGGDGGFDTSQFKGPDGQVDREALRAAFQAKGGGNFDPSQFQGKGGNRGGGTGDPSQVQGRAGGGTGRGGNGNGGTGRGGNGGANPRVAAFGAAPGGRGARGFGAPQQTQTVYRLNAKNEVEAVRIRTGLSDGNWVQLLGNNTGLEEGAELITAVEGLPAPANAKGGNNPQGFPGGNNQFKGNQGGGGFRF
ncbi:MAG: efflux RND transporter periplasmic adaptor subunit [Bryobacteraceae bacterium]